MLEWRGKTRRDLACLGRGFYGASGSSTMSSLPVRGDSPSSEAAAAGLSSVSSPGKPHEIGRGEEAGDEF